MESMGDTGAFEPYGPCCLEKRVGSIDIRRYERIRTGDGPIDMTLGREVHQCSTFVLAEKPLDEIGVSDVAMNE